MAVVSNTSPLSNLAIIDRLEILRGQFGQIAIPPAVQLELDRLSHPAARARLAAALQDGWVRVTPLTAARLKASQLGIPHTGVLGVLRRAKQAGQITSLAAEIRKLRADARFFISPALEKRLLAAAGE